MDYHIYYKLVRGAKGKRMVPKRIRRPLRRYLLHKVKKNHEWGWRIADNEHKQ